MKKKMLPVLLATILTAVGFAWHHRELFVILKNDSDLSMKLFAAAALILLLAVRIAWKSFLRRNPPESMPAQKDLLDDDPPQNF